uniref:Natriuretic peptide A variant NPPA-M1 n=1 Tax=Mus musculus TaxID=10090 RepID=N0A5N9_MOUSE|nr:natriuretic peptide precursor A variant NPPA-M1 [Mus musculus]AGK44861.1 natriuretic peptide precursor A variant NPPA-M2 [Mus musculus]AGK44862.1 natriuretic peptide precursor A variant NPPA-M3 [Mus musculus]
MGSFSITLGFFLVLAFWLPGHIGANPVYSAVSNTDLMDFKVGPGSGTQTGTRVSLVLGPFLRRPLSLYLFCLYKEPARPPGGEDAGRR